MKPPIDWLAITARLVLGAIGFAVAVMLLGLLALVAGGAQAQTLSPAEVTAALQAVVDQANALQAKVTAADNLVPDA